MYASCVHVVAVSVSGLHEVERHAVIRRCVLPQHVRDRGGHRASDREKHHDLTTRVRRTHSARFIVRQRERCRKTCGRLERPRHAIVSRHPCGHRVGGAIGVGVRGKTQDAPFGKRDEAWTIGRVCHRQRVETDRRQRPGDVAEDHEVRERSCCSVPARSDEDRAVCGN